MLEFKKIFCPVDLTNESAQALRYAVAFTRAYDAELTICHCLENKAQPAGSQVAVVQATLRNQLAEFVCLACPDQIEWDPLLLEGDAASVITQAAESQLSDLIVMRSRRRPHAAALLGSTAEAVCRTASCPVLITHPSEREWAGATSNDIELKRILLAHDFSPEADAALAYATSLAQEFQADLHTLHVIPSEDEGSVERAASLLRDAISEEVELWSNVKHNVRSGKPYREILAYAQAEQIDLICMGAHGAGFGLHALFGSNVDRVLRQSPCPILIGRPIKPLTAISVKALWHGLAADPMQQLQGLPA